MTDCTALRELWFTTGKRWWHKPRYTVQYSSAKYAKFLALADAGKTIEEIATETGLKQGYVKSMVTSGRLFASYWRSP